MSAETDPHPAEQREQTARVKAPREHALGAEQIAPDARVPAPEGIPVTRWGNDDLLELFSNETTVVRLEAGEILFKEGDPGTSMYVVRSGALRIRSGSVVFEDVVPGGMVGEMGLVEKHMPRTATVYALMAAELVEIDEARFFSLVEHVPSFAVAVMRVLSRRLRHMDGMYRLGRQAERKP